MPGRHGCGVATLMPRARIVPTCASRDRCDSRFAYFLLCGLRENSGFVSPSLPSRVGSRLPPFVTFVSFCSRRGLHCGSVSRLAPSTKRLSNGIPSIARRFEPDRGCAAMAIVASRSARRRSFRGAKRATLAARSGTSGPIPGVPIRSPGPLRSRLARIVKVVSNYATEFVFL